MWRQKNHDREIIVMTIFLNSISQFQHNKDARKLQTLDLLAELENSFSGIITFIFLGLNTHTIHNGLSNSTVYIYFFYFVVCAL